MKIIMRAIDILFQMYYTVHMNGTLSDSIRDALRSRVQPTPDSRLLSMREVARRTGLSVTTISRFLDGETITSRALDRIASFIHENGTARL